MRADAALLAFAALVCLVLFAFLGAQRVPRQLDRPLETPAKQEEVGIAQQDAEGARPDVEEPSHLSLQALYNRQTWPSSTSGPNQILVMGYYRSGASLVARLLMLMGVYAGEPDDLLIGEGSGVPWCCMGRDAPWPAEQWAAAHLAGCGTAWHIHARWLLCWWGRSGRNIAQSQRLPRRC